MIEDITPTKDHNTEDNQGSSFKKRKHNYIPKKGQLTVPTMRRTKEEMSEVDIAKEQLEGQLLEFQLQRDNVKKINFFN